MGDALADLDAFAQVAFLRRRLRRGQTIFHAGDPFNAIYAVRSGFFKTANVDATGREQVMGFFMCGELFGLDGVAAARYECTASALEDSEIVVLPFALMEELGRENQAMQRQLHAILSREITRDHGVMLLLGSMSAEARLATFLVNLSTRFLRRGYSPSDFVLRMTREEIGSYLGLKLETVSRLFSKFENDGLLDVQQKHVRILDPQGLQRARAVL
ncbi:MAG: cyclic nucleotide-binding domain-containing protein [Betaproteobacteria bacterium]|nr:MAG: cyclic nucleotide-binding domain-containing protein [Betaproteobacteria bacterium]